MRKILLTAGLLAAAAWLTPVPGFAATQQACPPGQQGSAGDQDCAVGTLGGPDAMGQTEGGSTATGASDQPAATDMPGTGSTTQMPNADMGGGSSSTMGGATESTQ